MNRRRRCRRRRRRRRCRRHRRRRLLGRPNGRLYSPALPRRRRRRCPKRRSRRPPCATTATAMVTTATASMPTAAATATRPTRRPENSTFRLFSRRSDLAPARRWQAAPRDTAPSPGLCSPRGRLGRPCRPPPRLRPSARSPGVLRAAAPRPRPPRRRAGTASRLSPPSPPSLPPSRATGRPTCRGATLPGGRWPPSGPRRPRRSAVPRWARARLLPRRRRGGRACSDRGRACSEQPEVI